MLETNLKYEKLLLMPYFQNRKSATNFNPPNRRWGPSFNWGAQKIVVFSGNSAVYPNMSAAETPLKSATLSDSCCLKTTLVVFVAKNCGFYQNLKKISTTNEN